MSLQLHFSDNLLMTGANTSAPFSGRTPRHTESVPGAGAPGELAVQGAEGAAREDGSGSPAKRPARRRFVCPPVPRSPARQFHVCCSFCQAQHPRGPGRAEAGGSGSLITQVKSKGFFHQLIPNGVGERQPGAQLTWTVGISALPVVSLWS